MHKRNRMRHLRALMAVVETGSIASAAGQLLRTASAVANSVRQLETDFGEILFERQSSGMIPTRFGNAAYRRADRIAAELRLAHTELARYKVSATAPMFSMLVGERQLSALVRLREMGHMPSVANVTGLSQPALSALLRQAEDSLELRLFRRTSKGMVVTEAGDLLLFRVRRILSELRHLEADIAQQGGEVAGRLKFAALPSWRTCILPQAIAALISNHPNVQVSMVDAPFEVLFAGVQSGEIDFILTGLGGDYSHRDFRVRVIGRDSLVAVVRAGHPLCKQERVDIADLVRYPWVLRDRGAPSRELLNDLFRRLGVPQPHVAVQAGDLGLLRGLLLHSDAVSAVSPENLAYEIDSGAIKVLDTDLPATGRDVGFMLCRDLQPSPLCETFMQYIERATADVLSPVRP